MAPDKQRIDLRLLFCASLTEGRIARDSAFPPIALAFSLPVLLFAPQRPGAINGIVRQRTMRKSPIIKLESRRPAPKASGKEQALHGGSTQPQPNSSRSNPRSSPCRRFRSRRLLAAGRCQCRLPIRVVLAVVRQPDTNATSDGATVRKRRNELPSPRRVDQFFIGIPHGFGGPDLSSRINH